MSSNKKHNIVKLLVLGVEGSGKTLLTKSLQYYLSNSKIWSLNDIPSHISTVGVNIANVKVTDTQKQERSFELKELGGSMGSLWPKYFDGCDGVIFTVDGANLQQISGNGVLLIDCLRNYLLWNIPFLAVITKCDLISNAKQIDLVKDMLSIDKLLSSRSGITLLENFSAFNGAGLAEISNWLASTNFTRKD